VSPGPDRVTSFRAVIEASPIPFAVNDDNQNITYLNPEFIRTFGYARADIPTLADWWPRAYPDPTGTRCRVRQRAMWRFCGANVRCIGVLEASLEHIAVWLALRSGSGHVSP
jgi:PAS domain-containing protein